VLRTSSVSRVLDGRDLDEVLALLDRDHLLSVLREIRADEEAGVQEVAELMEERA
jgi:hypothetical protein